MSRWQKGIKVGAVCLGIVLIVNIFSWCLNGLSLFMDISLTGKKEELVTFEESYENVESIEIEAVSSEIIIEMGTEFRVEAQNIEKNFSAKVKGTTLKIEESRNWFQNTSGRILVTVPSDVILKELKIDTGAGKFEIENIHANKLDMNHGAGLLEIRNSTFEETDIDGGAGEMKIVASKFETLELDAGVGRVELEAEITEKGQIECGVGELKLTLLGNREDYSIQSEKGIGSIEIDGKVQENHTVYGTGSRRITLEGGVGSIEVDFQN